MHHVGEVFFSPLQSIAKNDRALLCRQLLTCIFRRARFSLLSPVCVLFAAFCSWRTLACFFIPWSDMCSIPYFEQLFRRDEISWKKTVKKYFLSILLLSLLWSCFVVLLYLSIMAGVKLTVLHAKISYAILKLCIAAVRSVRQRGDAILNGRIERQIKFVPRQSSTLRIGAAGEVACCAEGHG